MLLSWESVDGFFTLWEVKMFFKNNNFKRVVSVSMAAVCMFSALKLVPIAGNEVSAADTLTAFEITEDMAIGWNLGNALDSTASSLSNTSVSTETAWGNPVVTQELIDAVKAKGFNTIRIPTTWYQHLDSDNNIDAAWLARVKEVVDYAYNQGMYVILNIHHEEWINRSDFATAYDEMSPKLIKIWTQIATYFSDYDQHLIFEGMNEPRAAGSSYEWTGTTAEYEVVNKLNNDFVNTVRSIDSPYKDTRLLMIPSYAASSYDSIYSYLEVPDDDYVAVSIHAYSPYDFAMNADVDDSVHETFTDKNKADLDTIFNSIRTYFTDNDIPVVIGEFSASNFNNTDARCDWAEYYISETKKYGIPCVLWDNNVITNSDASESHGYINRTTLQWYDASEPVVDTMISVINDDSIVWGSEKKSPTYVHDSIDSGKSLFKSSSGQTIDASVTDGNCMGSYDVSWSTLNGKDVAVKFTGDTPIVALMDSSWGNWTEIGAYQVDSENGIAYYSYDTIKAAWTSSSDPAHLMLRTNGKTTVTQISLINQAEVIPYTPETTTTTTTTATGSSSSTTTTTTTTTTVVEPTDPTEPTTSPYDFTFETKKYTVDISNRTDNSVATFVVEGTANGSIGGCVGYSTGSTSDDWSNIEWKATIGTDGKVTVTVDLSDVPTSVTSAEVQIWWSNVYDRASDSSIDVDCDMTDFSVSGQTVSDVVYGDANGDGAVDIDDMVAVVCYVSDPVSNPLSADAMVSADVYGNGDGVNAMDALAIQKYLVKSVDSLPITE
jgi:aryl-phospho-beta-D-glucosidase BglC (GH1 family)